jgi:hypothetical protein
LGPFCAIYVVEPVQILFQYFLIQKQDGGKRLILGRGRDLAGNGEIGKKGLDFPFAHFVRMALIVEKYEAPDPLNVGLLGSQTVVPDPNGGPDTVQQPWSVHDASLQTFTRILGKQAGGREM